MVTTDDFTNDYVDATRSADGRAEMSKFRDKYRNVDLLLVDDIQFLEGRKQAQEEFFNVFNAITKNGHQIVLTSDRLPKDMQGIEERLISRFGQGATLPISKPDLITKIGILKNMSDLENLDISNDVINLIAEKIDSNVRDLEGAFHLVAINYQVSNSPITLEQAESILTSLNITINKEITIENIQKIVGDFYHVSVTDLKSAKRNKEIVLPRQIAMYLSRQLTDKSLPKIGKAFGGRDHTTVMHSTDKVSDQIDNSQDFYETIQVLTDKIKEG
jgi:chromosomal replication initiator protein